jgi:putative transposase
LAGYRRFRCLDCTKQFNEQSSGLLNRTQYPSDVIALVVLWRLRYKLSLRDLAEMFLIRGFVFSYEAVRDWEAKLTPALAEELRRSRKGKVGRSWYTDERIFGCTVVGSTSTARSTVTAPWST